MATEAVFTLTLESELRDRFMAEAEAFQRPASELVREFMSEFIARQQAGRDHDAWFRAEVERGLIEADDPSIKRISGEEISAGWKVHRAELLARGGRGNA